MIENKILFVGVSPKPYYGCNYWYVDESGLTKPKTYVWVKMGRHNTEQIVYVDSIKWCDKSKTPYPIDRAKRILRQTTMEEVANAKSNWGQSFIII